jgi:hypothetical protein
MALHLAQIASAALLASLATGCAQMTWEKPGATSGSTSADLDSCYRSYRSPAPPQFSPEKSTPFSNAVNDVQHDTQPIQFPNTGYARDLATVQDYAARCMRELGYSLMSTREQESSKGTSPPHRR